MKSVSTNISQYDAAERIGVTIREMMRLIRKGIVPAAKVSLNRYLIDEKELDTAISNLRRKQTEERINKSDGVKIKKKRRNCFIDHRTSAKYEKEQSKIVDIIKNAPSWDALNNTTKTSGSHRDNQ